MDLIGDTNFETRDRKILFRVSSPLLFHPVSYGNILIWYDFKQLLINLI